ncbi:MAG: antA/AntB antirepressor family protein [Oscillospiraceae bacterium]|nr:antA/AntB antirepressor family protein [Oscillospiraceae bacterium]
MNELIAINYDTENPTVSGRELHAALEVKEKYTDWFKRMCEYSFTNGVDFTLVSVKSETNNPKNPYTTITDHSLTIPMAKELCMLQRNEKGKEFRQYFIRVEQAWNSPEMVMKRALDIANANVKQLQIKVATLSVDNEIMKPKADYFDELVERNTLTNFRETAKQLDVKEKSFINFLIDHKYIYRDKRGKLMPYADKNNGLFEIKECFNEKTQWSGTQTLVTPKGRETFRLLMLKATA